MKEDKKFEQESKHQIIKKFEQECKHQIEGMQAVIKSLKSHLIKRDPLIMQKNTDEQILEKYCEPAYKDAIKLAAKALQFERYDLFKDLVTEDRGKYEAFADYIAEFEGDMDIEQLKRIIKNVKIKDVKVKEYHIATCLFEFERYKEFESLIKEDVQVKTILYMLAAFKEEGCDEKLAESIDYIKKSELFYSVAVNVLYTEKFGLFEDLAKTTKQKQEVLYHLVPKIEAGEKLNKIADYFKKQGLNLVPAAVQALSIEKFDVYKAFIDEGTKSSEEAPRIFCMMNDGNGALISRVMTKLYAMGMIDVPNATEDHQRFVSVSLKELNLEGHTKKTLGIIDTAYSDQKSEVELSGEEVKDTEDAYCD